jgi:hypothetical protein
VIGGFAIVTIAMLVASTSGAPDAPPPGFVALWCVAVVWNGYWWLLRMPSRLELAGGVLKWKTPLRGGEIPIADLREVRPSRMAGRTAVFLHGKGQLTVTVTKGFQQFLDSLLVRRPDLPVGSRRRGQTGTETPHRPPVSHPSRPGRLSPAGAAPSMLPPPPVRSATPSWTRGPRWRWYYLLVFLIPIGALVLFLRFWEPGTGPIVSDGRGPFFVGTVIVDRSISLGSPDEDFSDRTDAVLAAVCHNYFDWLSDVTLNTDVVILEPSDGLVRSAELLDGQVEPNAAVLEAERLAVTGLTRTEILEQMPQDDWSQAERREADEYLRARAQPPSPSSRDRYVFYVAEHTTRSVVLFRLEVDLHEEIRHRGISTAGDLSLALPGDDTVYGINESVCWE